MTLDDRIAADRAALAARTAHSVPALADTRRALEETLASRASREGEIPMRSAPRSTTVAVVTFAAAATVLLCPVPYTRTSGWDVTLRAPDGHVAKVHLRGGSAELAGQRAAAMAGRSHTAVSVAPHTERVWGTVFAMAKESVLRLDVQMEGKSDAAVEEEIRAQLGQQGWTPSEVEVHRSDGTSLVQVGATDADGRRVQLLQQIAGGPAERVSFGMEDVDMKREPGMTDDELREKIRRQFLARGVNAEVSVEGGDVRVQVEQANEPR